MRKEFGDLRHTKLESGLAGFRAAGDFPRPERGWIHAMREALGVSTGELGRRLGTSRQLPLQFEKAEADDSITLKSLRRVGEALECELVYALVPRAGTMREPAKTKSRTASRKPSRISESRDGASVLEDGDEKSYFCD